MHIISRWSVAVTRGWRRGRNDALSEPNLPARASVTLHLLRALVYSSMHGKAEMADDLQWIIDSPDATDEERAGARQELHATPEGSTTKPSAKPASR